MTRTGKKFLIGLSGNLLLRPHYACAIMHTDARSLSRALPRLMG